MDLEGIYRRLKHMKLCSDSYDFSVRYLGKCESYYSVIKAKNCAPSTSALITLEYVLEDKAQSLASTPDKNTQRTKILLHEMSKEVRSEQRMRFLEKLL